MGKEPKDLKSAWKKVSIHGFSRLYFGIESAELYSAPRIVHQLKTFGLLIPLLRILSF